MPPIRCLALVLALALGACRGERIEPFDYTPIDEIPAGSGAFTGADGVWTIHSSDDE